MSDTVTSSISAPTTYRPDETPDIIFAEKGWLQGALLCAVAYGAVLVMFSMCSYLLIKQSKGRGGSLRKSAPLLAFITVITILSTLFMASDAQFTQLAFIENRNYPGGPAQYEADMFSIPVDELGNVSFVLSNWLCDALIVWRCRVIYKGSRFPVWAIMFFPCLLLMASLSMGILFLLQIASSSPFETSIAWTVPYFTLSLSLNIIVTIAIVARLLVYRHWITSVLGQSHGSQYTGIAAMIVESAAIYSLFSLLFLIPFAVDTTTSNLVSQIFLQSLGQMQIFATLLIVFRVAQGKGWSSDTQTNFNSSMRPELVLPMKKLSPAQFQQSQSGDDSTITVVNSQQKPSGITISQEVLSLHDTDDGSHKAVNGQV